MAKVNDAFLDSLSEYIYAEFIEHIPPAQKILIKDVGVELSSEIVMRCNSINASKGGENIHIVIMADQNNPENYEVSPPRAVEFRNQVTPLVIFIPSQFADKTNSLTGFTTYSISKIMRDLFDVYRKRNAILGVPDFNAAILKELEKLTKIDMLLRFAISVNVAQTPTEFFAANLPSIGLIADSSESVGNKLNIERNLRTSLLLNSKLNPLVTQENLLDSVGIINGATRNAVAEALFQESRTNVSWVRYLADLNEDSLLFCNWPFATSSDLKIQNLEIKSFLNLNGTINSRSQLKLHPTSNEFLSSGAVVVDWVCEPKKVASDIFWQVDVLNSANIDFAEVVDGVKGKSSLRSKKFDLKEFLEDGEQRFVIRVSAVDSFGATVLKDDGKPAVAYSEDFLLVLENAGGDDVPDPKKVSATSIPEAFVKAAIEDRFFPDFESVGQGLEHNASQTFEFPLGNRIARIRISQYVREIEKIAIAEPSKTFTFRHEMRLGSIPAGADSVGVESLDIPKSLQIARANYLECLMQDEKCLYPETLFWNESSKNLLEAYVLEYQKSLKSATPEIRELLLKMDLVNLRIQTSEGFCEATVILPIHPLRSLWLSDHHLYLKKMTLDLLDQDFGKRRNLIDLHLISKLSPENLPFAVMNTSEVRVYAGELVFGVGIYLPLDTPDTALNLSIVSNSLGVTREYRSTSESSSRVAEHLSRYESGNSYTPGLKIAVFNPGDGRLAADALRKFVKDRDPDVENQKRIEISTYSDAYSYSDPVGALTDLQKDLLERHPYSSSLFLPFCNIKAMSLADSPEDQKNDFDRQPESVNVSILQSATKLAISPDTGLVKGVEHRSALLNGLITYLHSFTVNSNDVPVFFTSASTGNNQDSMLGIESLHHAYLETVSGVNSTLYLCLSLDAQMTNLISDIHKRSEWVLTVDRYIGLNLFEELLSRQNNELVVLDYSPEFVDGFGDRLTLTTTKHTEVTRIIQKAMRELGLANEGKSSIDVLRSLARISGRLAMRLLNENSLATEAVGLCATVGYLEENSELDQTIIIPVDAHQELFGLNRHDPDAENKRCDLVLVRLVGDAYELELLEVKARKGRAIADLPRVIQNQLDNTEALLRRLLFDESTERIDRDLQWSRWASLLHFYADRSILQGNFTSESSANIHARIQRLCDTKTAPRIGKSGYIVSLLADEADINSTGQAYKMRVLNEEKLISSGWTTIKEHVFMVGSEPEVFVKVQDSPVNSEVDIQTEAGTFVQDTEIPLAILKPVDREEEVIPIETAVQNRPKITSVDAIELSDVVSVALGEDSAGNKLLWNISLKGSPHGVIVGIPGQGKSVTTRNILNQFAEQGLPSVVFDFHGDMGPKLKFKSNEINVALEGLPFSPFEFDSGGALPIRTASQEIAEILESIGNLGEIQTTNVNLAIRDAYRIRGWDDKGAVGDGYPDIEDFKTSLATIESQNKGKNAGARLLSFTDYELFRSDVSDSFNVLNPEGWVFNVSKYRQDEVRITAGAFILRRIYNEMFQWENATRPRLAIVLDEAHRLSKDPTIPKIMKEGRKFGVIVLLVSQSMDDFAPQVIDNAGSKIAFRTNFPASKKVASFLQSKNSAGLADQLENLTTANAYVSTPDLRSPKLVRMDSE
jgi:DNA phosphorothioation-dependent restriction protein DptH